MTDLSSKLRSNKPLRFALIPAKMIYWAAKGQLRPNLKLSRSYRLVTASGIFDSAFYRQQAGSKLPPHSDPLKHYLVSGGIEGLDPNPLFDSSWYLEQNPDVAQSAVNPLVHFLQAGWQEKRNPHPLFDLGHYLAQSEADRDGVNPLARYWRSGHLQTPSPHILFDNQRYIEQNPDVVQAGENPLAHYLRTGWVEGRSPHRLFSDEYYLRQCPELKHGSLSPLLHFVTEGYRQHKNPISLFDVGYYNKLYPDIQAGETNSLTHYIVSGGSELRNPHPLFDARYYTEQLSRSNEGRSNPLLDYLSVGAREGLKPHALFDTEYYCLQLDPATIERIDGLTHYLEVGASLGFDPCELFDTSFYLAQHPEIARSGQNPLVHYVLDGASKGFNPNPLFDSAYYLKQYPDVAASAQNPLIHYIEAGAIEGRAPSPFFDALFYFRQVPSLKKSGSNPLVHYLILGGAQEGYDPSPFFSGSKYLREHPELKGSGVNPLVHFLGLEARETDADDTRVAIPGMPLSILRIRSLKIAERKPDTKATVICITHVSPIPARAGNEYRIDRLLRWFASENWEVIPVLSPISAPPFSDAQLLAVESVYSRSVLCQADGRVTCCLSEEDTALLQKGSYSRIPAYSDQLGEVGQVSRREAELLSVDRTFCPDTLIRVVTELAAGRQRCVVLAEYVFMSRVLPLLNPETLKIIDTHDVFSTKRDKVVAVGIADSLGLTEEEESLRLRRADLVLAIQPEEGEELRRITGGHSRIITVGVDFPIAHQSSRPDGNKVLYVASDNQMNVQGLNDFLLFAWPFILASVPDAELYVAGKVCHSIRYDYPRVNLLGSVDDLPTIYSRAKVVVNPVLAGTGLKIKTLESLSNLRPLVTWPTGVDGLHPELRALCYVVHDWFEFHQKVTALLSEAKLQPFSADQQRIVREHLSSAAVYGPLSKELAAMLKTAKAAIA